MLSLTLKLALNNLSHNKGRTALTVLGIIIGTTAVITVLSTGQAIKSLIVGEVESFGSNYIQLETKTPSTKQNSTENAFSMVGGSVITSLKDSDAQAILKHPNVAMYYSGVMGQEVASAKGEIKKVMIFGTNENFVNIDTSKVGLGRFFTEEENNALARVVVLGAKVKDKIFGESDAVGQPIKLGKESFQVVGIMERRGASFSLDMDNMVFIPVKTLQKKILGIDYLSFIIAQLKDPSLTDQTAADIKDIMREQHDITDPNKDDFAVTTMQEAMAMLDTIIQGIQILLIALGSISLIVGGVGIMNIMYVSVTERTYEIGLRKAVGAKAKNILSLFLLEALILTILGSVLGVIFGLFISWLVSIIASAQGFDWNFSVSLPGILLALGMSMIIGLVFGLYPARKAARLNPIEALRQE
jgi:putative ABC transport system permease protein